MSKQWRKKLIALSMAIALFAGIIPVNMQTAMATEAEEKALKFGVISDTHLIAADNDQARQDTLRNALTYYKEQAVELIAINGDLVDLGEAAAYDKILKIWNEVFPEEASAPELFVTADNHEYYTQWGNLMNGVGTAETTQKVFMEKFGLESTNNTLVIDDYYFIGISSDGMTSSGQATYEETTVAWLEEQLEVANAASQTRPIYLFVHQPPKGTVSYAGTPQSLDAILEKYPQIIMFTSHTHASLQNEHSIYQEKYTVINTATTYYLYEAATAYGAANYGSESFYGRAQGLLVTAEDTTTTVGRYDFSDSTAEEIKTPWVIENPSNVSNYQYTLEKQTAGRVAPVFADGAGVSAYTYDNQKVGVVFPAATHEDFVHGYEIVIKKGEEVLLTKGVVSDFVYGLADMSSQCEYIVELPSELEVGAEYTVSVSAFETFGQKSAAITGSFVHAVNVSNTSKANKNLFDGITAEQVETSTAAYKNLDGYLTGTLDNRGVLTTELKLSGENVSLSGEHHDEIVFWTDRDKFEKYGDNRPCTWCNPTMQAADLTAIDKDSTFVYETEFQVTSEATGTLYFIFRTNDDITGQTWRSDYTGVVISDGGTELQMFQNRLDAAPKYQFRLSDAKDGYHKLTILSSKDTVSVWIDGRSIFEEVPFDITQGFDKQEDGTYVSKSAADCIATTSDMIPTVGMFVYNTDVKLTNQYLYLYDHKEQVADEIKALDVNQEYYDSQKISYGGQVANTGMTIDGVDYNNPVVTGNTITAYAGLNSEFDASGYVEHDLTDVFTADDTVIMEFDYTPSHFAIEPSNTRLVEIRVRFRTDGTNHAQLLLRHNWSQKMLYFADGGGNNTDLAYSGNAVEDGKKVHVKIISDKEKVTVYMDGACVLKDYVYNDLENITCDTDNMRPAARFQMLNALWNLENISIRNADTAMKNVTALDDNNNLLANQGQIISSFKGNKAVEGVSNSVVNGCNIYSDLTWNTLYENGYTGYDMEERFSLFDKNNAKLPIKSTDSFVISTLARISNNSLTDSNGKSHVARAFCHVGSYDGKSAWYFIQDEKLFVYYTKDGSNQLVAEKNLNAEIGYRTGDYFRLTTLVSPFGYDIYINGTKIYTFEAGNGNNVDYSSVGFKVAGAEVRFLDISVHYNTENGMLYKEKLLEEVEEFDNLRGVYFADKESVEAKITEVKENCALATDDNTALKELIGVVRSIIHSGKIVNNKVLDGSGALAETIFDLDLSQGWPYSNVTIMDSAAFGSDETWVFEADAVCTGNSASQTRIGFGVLKADGDRADVAIIGNRNHYHKGNGSWGVAEDAAALSESWGAGANWHMKYTVKPYESITTEITRISDGAVLCTSTVAWSDMVALSGIKEEDKVTFKPYFMVVGVDVQISNIYVGYDLKTNIDALQNVIDVAEATEENGYTYFSYQALQATVSECKAAKNAIDNYVESGNGVVYTTPYTKDEINGFAEQISEALAQLKISEKTLTIGDGVLNQKVEIGYAEGEELPVGDFEKDGAKYYIIGWSGETANFVDKKMLEVKYQEAYAEGYDADSESPKYRVRFFGSVNSLEEYDEAGLIFSFDDSNANSNIYTGIVRKTNEVYKSVYADNEKVNVSDIYDDYSSYLFGRIINNIPHGQQVYVRAFVKMADGTYVYGETREIVMK